jgi:hypothetical protein
MKGLPIRKARPISDEAWEIILGLFEQTKPLAGEQPLRE